MEIDVSFLDNLDTLIKQGQGEKVRVSLHSIRSGDVPRKHRAALAKIALRVGDSNFAFSLLRPLAQSETPVHPPVSDDELIQFGMCLKQMGASDHALNVFASVKGSANPDVHLYEAITLFTQWRYAEAIPKLQSYLTSQSITEYQKMIGSLNLASAYIFEGRYQDASEILRPLIEEASRHQHHLIRGNSLELMAQLAIHQRQFAEAEEYLKEGRELIQKSAPVYRLFLEKWSAISNLFQTNVSLESLKNLNSVRNQAIELQHWESVRDCDFFFAIAKVDQHLFHRLYFGTPYQAYRQRLLKQFPGSTEIPEYFDWRGNTAHHSSSDKTGMIDLRSNKGSQNLRLIKALSMDFYNPIKPFPLYLNLFPDEKLDPTAALPRIFTAVSRAKKWLAENSIPIEIEHSDSGYRLHWTGVFVIRMPSGVELQKPTIAGIEKLQKYFPQKEFSCAEASEKVGISQRSMVRILKNAVTDQVIEVRGQGKSTRYSFKLPKSS